MNTTPDEVMLAMWLDDELTGEDLARFELLAAADPELWARREESRQWRGFISSSLPNELTPPYPELFNRKVMQGIRAADTKVPAAPLVIAPPPTAGGNVLAFPPRRWALPLASAACVMLAFYLGRESAGNDSIADNPSSAPTPAEITPSLTTTPRGPIYTPDQGVKAEWIVASDQSTGVIVLKGLAALPDSTDLTGTAMVHPTAGERATASNMGSAKPATESPPAPVIAQ